MMTGSAIRELSRRAARNAARRHKTPFLIEKEDIEDWKAGRPSASARSIPFLGDYVPKGWKRTDRRPLFVDSSGFGSEGEPALTISRFLEALTVGMGYAVIEAGQFQVYVAEYAKDPT